MSEKEIDSKAGRIPGAASASVSPSSSLPQRLTTDEQDGESCDTQPLLNPTGQQRQTGESSNVSDHEGPDGSEEPEADPSPSSECEPWYKRRGFIGAAVGTAVGAGVAIVAAPLVIGAIGFGSGGIVAGSYAASMMSSAAIANGGGVAAGSLVATLQSIGAAGFGSAGLTALGAGGGAAGAGIGGAAGAVMNWFKGSGNQEENGSEGNAEKGKAADDDKGDGKEGDGKVPAGKAGDGKTEGKDLSAQLVKLSLQQKDEEFFVVISSDENQLDKCHAFPMSRDQPLEKVFSQYCERASLARESVHFEFSNMPITGADTPEDLQIESGDTIRALL